MTRFFRSPDLPITGSPDLKLWLWLRYAVPPCLRGVFWLWLGHAV